MLAAPEVGVAEVDGDRFVAQADFSSVRFGQFHILEAQNIRPAELVEANGLHASSPRPLFARHARKRKRRALLAQRRRGSTTTKPRRKEESNGPPQGQTT